jgi:hypothetical protein
MHEAFSIAMRDFRARNPRCNVSVDEQLGISDEESLYKNVKNASIHPGRNVLVGITRSNFARLAARAAQGSKLRGISSAAFTDELHAINPNFISISSPWIRQWDISKRHLVKAGCSADDTVGIFTFRDVLSKHYRKGFFDSGYRFEYDVDKLEKLLEGRLAKTRCVFMGTSLPGSMKPLSFLYSHNWGGTVVGMGDWTFYTPEMKQFLKRSPGRKFRIFSPLVWSKDENPRVREWISKNLPNMEVEPLTIGVYDSTILGLQYLCRGEDIRKFDAARWANYGLLRDYTGLAESGNLLSPMHFVEIGKK